ncbi:NYN domain-containing protein [Floridanema evergladense]|uniref:NYN domain-containing protein n=1 Tax=Floridaenema evergladense BLCC-F167 TaxID=3153639 RepID=A0ABV4WNJ2_9CYAN
MKPPSPSAFLLVDGYNIIGSWQKLLTLSDRKGLEAAREELIQLLINYTAYQGYHTQIVFDAHYRASPGNAEEITSSLSVHFTDFGQTADTYIEKACATLRHELQKFQRRIIVATSDRAQQLTIIGYGAEWMSAHKLVQEIEFSIHRVRRKQKSKNQLPSRFLFSSLDPEAQKRLAQMRYGLK